MDRPVNNLQRSFAFFFYFIMGFVGVRVWIEVIDSKSQTAEIITGVVTFLVVLCIYLRYRKNVLRDQAVERINRERMNLFNEFLQSQHPGINQATGGLTQATINELPTKIYGVTHDIQTTTLVNKLEEGSLSETENTSNKVFTSTANNEFIDYSNDNHHNCSICISDFATHDVLLELPICQHCYHKECINEWLLLHNTCPLCKSAVVVLQPLVPPTVIRTGPEVIRGHEDEQQQGQGSGRLTIEEIHARLAAIHAQNLNDVVYRSNGYVDILQPRNNSSINRNEDEHLHAYPFAVSSRSIGTPPPSAAAVSATASSSSGDVQLQHVGQSAMQHNTSSSSAAVLPEIAVVYASMRTTSDENSHHTNETVTTAPTAPTTSGGSNQTARHFDSHQDEYTNEYLK